MSDEIKHSPEPWRAADEGRSETILDAHGVAVIHADWDSYGYTGVDARIEWPWWSNTDNRRRVVACVNACAGIPTEALEAGKLGEALATMPTLLAAINGAPFPNNATRIAYDALRALGRLP